MTSQKIKLKKNEYHGAVEILFNHFLINITKEIFLILKLYAIQKDINIENIYIISKDNTEDDEKKKTPIYSSISKDMIKKMNYTIFKIWYDSEYNNNWQYTINHKYYGFRIKVDKNSPYFKEEKLYFKYPIEKKIINILMPENKYKINRIRINDLKKKRILKILKII